ncbi:MAG: hypothetical protein JWN03_3188 [Nocardia sp.]|uniref:DoxX family protein n=1 Tax=Nocardia sp. TaxID=1821 RepID=UPI0026366C3B|nr:DoxX family protein [Nocardia sp.]MCU1642913.1 hypothetical protein [Nocardia sp.]
MFIVTAIVSAVLAALLVFSAVGKLRKDAAQVKVMETVGFPLDKLWLLAASELAGDVGLVVGLFWWPIGVAAAVGVILYFVGAVVAHVRVRDNPTNAVVMLAVAIAVLILRLVTI